MSYLEGIGFSAKGRVSHLGNVPTIPFERMHIALCLIFMILVSLENVKKYSHVVARLPQRLKSTLFEIFSTLRVPFGHPPFEKISNNVDFSL